MEGLDDVNHPGYESWYQTKEVLESNKPTPEELKKLEEEEEERQRQKRHASGISFQLFKKVMLKLIEQPEDPEEESPEKTA